jgi:hypothetical protein
VVLAIGLIGGDPTGGHASIQRPAQHLLWTLT